jgi:hypothetical protein
MLAIWVASRERDFMNTRFMNYGKQEYLLIGVLLIFCLGLNSCKPDLTDDAIPVVPFGSVSYNLNLPQFQDLKSKGYLYLNDIGVKGVILHRLNTTAYIAYERNCSYKPNEACATVDVHASTLYMVDSCCASTFDFASGTPTSGPAWRPLRRYETILSGTNLTITDAIVN